MRLTLAQRSTWLLRFKLVVYPLLALNVLLFLRHGTPTEALDQLGWVMLLAAFEIETRGLGQDYRSALEKYGLWVLQLAGYGLAVNAAWQYWQDGELLDFTNAALWLLVCVTLFYDVFVPGDYSDGEWNTRGYVKGALYVALAACAVLYGIEGSWLDFYDALLWLLCFFVVELNIIEYEAEEEAAAADVR